MARRTFTFNAYEGELTQPLNIGVTTAILDSTAGLASPVYLVVDPDVEGKREWIRVNGVQDATTLINLVRDQTGSVGDINHDVGAKVRAIFAMQHLDDIFLDIAENTAAGQTHIDDTGDPHAAAGYLKTAIAQNDFVRKDGSTMTGFLLLSAAPTADLHAATKLYVDNAIGGLPPAFDGDHANLSNVLPDQHHSRYTDNDAQLAMGAIGDINPFHHDKFTDADAVAAVHSIYDPGAIGDGNPENHNRYTDGEAVAAVDLSGFYTKGEMDTILQQYYTRNTDARAFAGRRIYIEAADPGAIANGDIWHDLP